jgi:hypothetical protein
MKTSLVALALTSLVVQLTVAEPASSQIPQRRLVRVGLGGGVSVPTSNAADALKNGINAQAYLLLDIGVPIRLNLGYQKFDFEEAILGAGTSGDSQMLSGVAGLSIDLFQIGPLRPYVTAGLGAFRLEETTGQTSTTDVRFGIDGGGGLALTLGRLEAFVEGRVQNVYTEAGVIDTKTIRAIPVTFGLLF